MSGHNELPPRWYGAHAGDQADQPAPAPEPSEAASSRSNDAADGAAVVDDDFWGQYTAAPGNDGQQDNAVDRTVEQDQDDDGASDPTPGEAVRQSVDALFGRDLIAPGPGLPFGSKAGARRQRRAEIRETARQRRRALRAEFDPAQRSDPPASQWRPVDRRSNLRVIASLSAVVVAVAGAMWLFTGNDPRPAGNTPPVPPVAPSTSAPAPGPAVPPEQGDALGPVAPIPPGGVAPIMPPTPKPRIDPASVPLVPVPEGPPSAWDLSAPEAASAAWFARWCPYDYREPFGQAQQRARPAMTALGWDGVQLDDRARMSWDKVVAAREIARCSAPSATVVPEAPRSATNAIVRIEGTRVVTPEGGQPYASQVTETRIVKLDADGQWRVDTATRGG